MIKMCKEKAEESLLIKDIVNSALTDSKMLMQFLLDCTVKDNFYFRGHYSIKDDNNAR